MGLLDTIVNSVLGGSGSGALSSVLGSVLNSQGGVSGLVQKMEQAGLGGIAQSWVGNGANQPVAPDQLGRVFGPEQVSQWAQQAGTTPSDLLGSLSRLLPHAVDHATPNGQIESGASPFDTAGTEFWPQRG